MNKPLMIHTSLTEPDFDLRAFTVTERICAEAVEIQDEAIVSACIRAAREAGITQLYLLDKQFITEAIREKVVREMQKQPTIDLEDDSFGAVLNCAVRYALGRRSYMPYLVTSFITPLLPQLSKKTIWCFRRDLEECRDFGDPEIDKPIWEEFLRTVIEVDGGA